METELKALKEMVTELRQARYDWKAQAGPRLAMAGVTDHDRGSCRYSVDACIRGDRSARARTADELDASPGTACAFQGIGLCRGATKPGSGAHTRTAVPYRRAH